MSQCDDDDDDSQHLEQCGKNFNNNKNFILAEIFTDVFIHNVSLLPYYPIIYDVVLLQFYILCYNDILQ